MKTIISLALLWVLGSCNGAEIFKDDFNREPTDWGQANANQGVIGEKYTIKRGRLRVVDQKLEVAPGDLHELLINDLDLGDLPGKSIVISVDIMTENPSDGGAIGLLFNYQDTLLWQGIRFRGEGKDVLQYLTKNGGDGAGKDLCKVSLGAGVWYRLTVTLTKPNFVGYLLTPATDLTDEIARGNFVMAGDEVVRGGIALHATGTGKYWFDNLSVKVE